MPLARILTLVPEATSPLVAELRRMGFTVEVADPNQEQPDPADLEIEFAVCDQQQVLGRAAAIAAQLRAEVVVFPDVIPPLPKATPVVAEVPVAVTALPEVPAAPPQQQNRYVEEEEREFGLQLPAGTWLSGMGEKLRTLGQRTASRCRTLIERFRPAVGSGLTKIKNGVSSTSGTIAERAREYQEKIKSRAAEARVARKLRVEEIERQRAENAERTAMMEQDHPLAPENPLSAEQQLQIAQQVERQKRLADMERLRAEAREQVAALERARMAAEAEHRKLKQQSEPSPGRRFARNLRPQSSQLKGVFTGAAAATVLFMVGMLLANFHPTTPLPVNMTNSSMEQQTPFGATTVHGTPGVTLGGVKTPKPAPAVKSAAPVAPQLKPQPAKSSASVAKKKSQWRHFRQGSNQDQGVADDVVVRHYAPAQKPVAKTTQQQAGLKHYSDQ